MSKTTSPQATTGLKAIPPVVSVLSESATQESVPRCDHRYWVDKNRSEIRASLTYQSEDKEVEIACRVENLNNGGVALSYRGAKSIDSEVVIFSMKCPESGTLLYAAGRVRWSSRNGLDTFMCGLQFRRPLPESTLETMVAAGQISRRGNQRVNVKVPVALRFVSSPPVMVPQAHVVCVSNTGAKIKTSEPIPDQARLLIKLPDNSTVTAQTVWTSQVDGGYALGIEFPSSEIGLDFFDAAIQLSQV